MSEKMVKVVLLKSMQLGNAGDTVEVPEAVATHMVTFREMFDGRDTVKYRTARLASEKVEEPKMEELTQADMAAAGKVNKVETPADEILPKRLKGFGKKTEEHREEKKHK